MHRVAITVSMVLRTVTPRVRNARKFLADQHCHRKCSQRPPGVVEIALGNEASQDLRQDRVADGQRLASQQAVQLPGLDVTVPLK
jgi:hypothetical protein